MFYEALDKYGDLSALGFKRQDKWEYISYYQYYQIARKVAKGFLKVRTSHTFPVHIHFQLPTHEALEIMTLTFTTY